MRTCARTCLASKLGILILAASLSGCVSQNLTKEKIWPGEPPDLVIEWPPGVVGVYTSTTQSGTTYSVAPLPEQYWAE